MDDTSGTRVPRDRFSIVYLIFCALGLGVLIPWNFFIAATDYFDYKLSDNSSESTYLRQNFPNSMTLASMVPFALCNILNLFITDCCSSTLRFHIGNTLVFASLVVTVVLVQISTKPVIFFGITLLVIAILNSGAAILQGATLSIISNLPPHNVGGYLEGQALAGILSALAKIIVIAAATSELASASAYFSLAMIYIALTTGLFVLLLKNHHFMYYQDHAFKFYVVPTERSNERTPLTIEVQAKQNPLLLNESTEFEVSSAPREAGAGHTINEVINSLKQAFKMGFVACFTLLTTLAVYPTLFFLCRIDDDGSEWKKKYFMILFVVLLYNVCDYASRKIAIFIRWPGQQSPWLLIALSLLRIVLVLLTMFCNQSSKINFPILLHHEAFVPILVLLLGLSNGYLLTLAFLYAPSYASPGQEEKVGVAMGMYVAFGLGLGVAVSFPLKVLISF